MSYFDDLLSRYCPNGVEYKTLGELGVFYGGLTGKSKNDFVDGNAVFISYRNVYANPALDIHPVDRVRIYEGEKQRTLQYGDVIFTGSSETPDECGFSSVVTEKPTEPLYLNSFCFFFRMYNPEMLLPDFAKHLFRSGDLRYQIGKTASGVTRFNVSKEKMQLVEIPIPPLSVQQEIVRILDKFTLLRQELSEQLAAELTARKKQYEHYRDGLFDEDETRVRLDTVASIYDGTHQTPKYQNEGIPFISVENINNIYGSHKYISHADYDKYKVKPQLEDVFMTRIGSIGKCAVFEREEEIAYYVSLALIRPDKTKVRGKYLKYIIESGIGARELYKRTLVNAVPIKVNKDDIGKIVIPIPSLTKQDEIIGILDRFDVLYNDFSFGIPAEIEARTKQYEYYRDKLLTFKRKEVV